VTVWAWLGAVRGFSSFIFRLKSSLRLLPQFLDHVWNRVHDVGAGDVPIAFDVLFGARVRSLDVRLGQLTREVDNDYVSRSFDTALHRARLVRMWWRFLAGLLIFPTGGQRDSLHNRVLLAGSIPKQIGGCVCGWNAGPL